MSTFRKKPIVVEAFQWTADENQIEDPSWIVDLIVQGKIKFRNQGTRKVSMLIRTLEGTMEASLGDWIIKGVKGEVYPCKPDIFEATYEPADRDSPADLAFTTTEEIWEEIKRRHDSAVLIAVQDMDADRVATTVLRKGSPSAYLGLLEYARFKMLRWLIEEEDRYDEENRGEN